MPGTNNVPEPAAIRLGGTAAEKLAAARKSKANVGTDLSALTGGPAGGRSHKPTHTSGKQGKREKKLRW